ncbi:hypothetical protein TRAPUB_7331 [Trametes pubescens]|uniref:Uncharacterized protein n=1 Tax=Trametes pubescens TaxID=154538 RepID=A0A1M2V3Y5_TRAPU|nr:hypothetical protein TRAPUB_7331 [Trametes pubescens]
MRRQSCQRLLVHDNVFPSNAAYAWALRTGSAEWREFTPRARASHAGRWICMAVYGRL